MQSDFISKINNAIKWSFYILFFFVPLIMWPTTYELFEFNKMWFVFGMSLVIAFLWGSKMIVEKRFAIRRTPLDIPLTLFLLSQIISTIYSVDPHTSFWGYYSRFNGGLLSTISYIFLYYAFATNLISNDEDEKLVSYKLLFVSLLSGLVVTLWGIPSHFGVDFTCFFFRGSPDTSCWTASFQPTIRIFSTLGQPNWLGTYLAALIPIALGFGFLKLKDENKLFAAGFLLLAFLFFVALLFSRSQSSFLGLAIGMIFFVAILIFKNLNQVKKLGKNNFSKYLIAIVLIFVITNFLIGDPVSGLNKFTTLNGLQSILVHKQVSKETPTDKGDAQASDIRIGGSESGDIRLIVWQGALKLFEQHPLFGTGVETFAYTYYGVKPLAHNLTSEWDYLYNKAHNEYLNYLATTGIFGLGTYLLFVGVFGWFVAKSILKKTQGEYFPISMGIAAGMAAMLVSNFFGFSVVVINLFIFTFPILFLDFESRKSLKKTFAIPKTYDEKDSKVMPFQTIGVVVLLLIALYYEFFLFNFWQADQKYALGYNLDHASEYGQGYQPLADAVKMLPQEDLYKDELSINMATIALLLADEKNATQAAQAAQQAKAMSDYVNEKHPNNIVYLKTRARVFFALSEIDPKYLDQAIAVIEQARTLAPTDAKLAYNEGLFYQQKDDLENAVKYIQQAIDLKPNYGDAYYSLALIYSDLAKKNPTQSIEFKLKEKEALETVLTKIDPSNKQASDLLKTLQ